MTPEELASVTLRHLQAVRAKQDEQSEQLGRIESRLSSLETTVAGMRRDLAHIYGDVVEGHTRMDQMRCV